MPRMPARYGWGKKILLPGRRKKGASVLLARVIIDAGERLVALVVAREDKGCSLAPGSTVYCTIPPAAINVFPHY